MKFSSKKPNLFIAGAPKAGTSFLYQQLKQHPQLFFPEEKELNFFSWQELDGLGSYYHDKRVRSMEAYLKYFEKSTNEKYLVDSSISYFSFKESAQKIYNFNKKSKIVFILRNPIERTFSHYLMDKRLGHALLPFTEYLSNAEKFPFHFHQYVEISKYHQNIQNYISLFGSDNICILFLEELENSLIQLFKFLDVEFDIKSINTGKKVNTNKKAGNAIYRFFYKNRILTNFLKKVTPNNIIKLSKDILYIEQNKPVLDHADYINLKNQLNNDIRYLSEFMGKDLISYWKIDK